jgi:hypothetical protein
MNRMTNKHHRDIQYPTKKEMKGIQMNKTIEQLKIDLENLNMKHDIMVANLKYINMEINLLEQELKIELDNESPFTSVHAMARLLGIIA